MHYPWQQMHCELVPALLGQVRDSRTLPASFEQNAQAIAGFLLLWFILDCHGHV